MAETIACVHCGADDPEIVYRHPKRELAHAVCGRCGLGYLSPRPTAREIDDTYAGYRQAYPDDFLADPEGPFAATARERAAFSAPWLEPGAKVLEVGCGYGHYAASLGALGHSVTGLEPSAHQVDFARSRLRVASVERGSLHDVPADGRFDLAAMFHVIEHLRNPQDALERLAAAVRPGGLVFLDLPNAMRLPCDAIEHFYVASGQHLFTFTPRVLAAMAARAGLEPLRLAHEPLPSVYEANLRMVARRVAKPMPGPTPAPEETADRLRRHRRQLDRLGARVSGRITAWRAAGRRVAIYGAGFHTLGLLDLCGLSDREIALVVDDDAAKHGTRLAEIPVEGPGSLKDRGIDAVLVSSLAAESAIAEKLVPLAECGVEIGTVYGSRGLRREPRFEYMGVEWR